MNPITVARPLMWLGSMFMVLDAATTYAALKYGEAAELNPLMAWLIETYTLEGAMLFKAVLGMMCIISLAHVVVTGWVPEWSKWGRQVSQATVRTSAFWVLAAMTALMAMVVGNNLHAILVSAAQLS